MRFIVFILLFLSLFGCSYKDIEDYALILGLGIDKINENIKITFEVFEEEKKSKIIEIEKKSIEECFDSFEKENKTIPYINHCSIVILGEECAKENIKPVLDFIIHDPDFRITTILCIAKEKMASEIFDNKKNNIVSTDLSLAYDLSIHKSDCVDIKRIYNLIDQLIFCNSVFVPIVSINDEAFDISGGALIEDFKLKFFVNKDEINYLKILKNKLKSGIIKIDDFEIKIKNCKTNLSFKNDNLFVYTLMEVMVYQKLDYEELVNLENFIKNKLEKKLKESLEFINTYKVDPLNMQQMIFKNDPILYSKISDDFYLYYSKLKFDVKCNVNILTSGYSNGF